jgi:2'-5' RNA ligase
LNKASARLFFALWPDAKIRRELIVLQSRLAAQGRRVPARRLHITLAFLGQVRLAQLPLLRRIAARLALPAEPMLLDRLGWFEKAGAGWLGCSAVAPAWTGFARGLNVDLQAAGFRHEDRPWQPHVTLYRDLRKPFEKIRFEAVQWTAESFCLVLSPHHLMGLGYTRIGSWP